MHLCVRKNRLDGRATAKHENARSDARRRVAKYGKYCVFENNPLANFEVGMSWCRVRHGLLALHMNDLNESGCYCPDVVE